jgi:hypothetical protein
MLFTIVYKVLAAICPNYENQKLIGLISILFGLVLYAFLFTAINHFTGDYHILGNLSITAVIFLVGWDYYYLGYYNLGWTTTQRDFVKALPKNM